MVESDTFGICSKGRIIHLEKDGGGLQTFNGRVTVQNLDRSSTTSSAITGGFIEYLHPRQISSVTTNSPDQVNVVPAPVVPAPSVQVLPEVIVVGYLPASGSGPSLAYYLSFQSMLGMSGSGGGGSATGPIGGGPGAGIYGPVGGARGVGLPLIGKNNLLVNYETSSTRPGIDVTAFMKCFSQIPDAGATCSVMIFTDLPVNDDPSYIFNILTGATGHCFLQLTKSNGAASVSQTFGFTTSKPLAVLGLPVAGKIVDNTGHKFNASFTMNLTAAQLQAAINAVIATGSSQQYDIWNHNCVDYALGIINTVRPGNPLKIVKLKDIETGELFSSPQGLYMTLGQMKEPGSPEAKNIIMNVVQHAGTSHGPCN